MFINSLSHQFGDGSSTPKPQTYPSTNARGEPIKVNMKLGLNKNQDLGQIQFGTFKLNGHTLLCHLKMTDINGIHVGSITT